MIDKTLLLTFLPFIILNVLIYLNINKIFFIINISDNSDGIRKMHDGNVPPLGGLVIILNITLLLILKILNFNFTNFLFVDNFESLRHVASFFFVSILIFFLGLYDDRYGIKPFHKLFGIIIILIGAVSIDTQLLILNLNFSFYNENLSLNSFSMFFTILSIALLMNAINMFDGINMLVGLYSILIFISFLLNNFMPGITIVLLMALSLFLIFNSKGKLFLGDNGSLLLGYIISFYFIKSYNSDIITNSDEIFMFMIFPGLDLLRLCTQRLINGKHPFSADRNHIHHLLKVKYGDFKTLILLISLILIPLILHTFIDTLYCNIIGIFNYLLAYLLAMKKNTINQ